MWAQCTNFGNCLSLGCCSPLGSSDVTACFYTILWLVCVIASSQQLHWLTETNRFIFPRSIRSLVYGCNFFTVRKQEHFNACMESGNTRSMVTFKKDIKQRQLIAPNFSCWTIFLATIFRCCFFLHANMHFPFANSMAFILQ